MSVVSEEGSAPALSAAQRARSERNRQRARALHEARLVRRDHSTRNADAKIVSDGRSRAIDSGGGFLLEEEAAAPTPVRAAQPPAPVLLRADMPRCDECARPFPHSYLLDTFDCSVCDECRDDEEAHALITRTEALSEYLLKECDLDAREPPLRCVRRRNPHRGGADMRLYVRAAVRARALLVWGSEAALEAERARREERRLRARHTHAARRLRALRMDVRSSLYARGHAAHEHAFGEERPQGDDVYTRACTTCGHVETYEKM